MKRRDVLERSISLAATVALPMPAAWAQGSFNRFRGQTLNMSIPMHPHYDAMVKLLPVFTEKTGIRVEVDRQPVPKMKELQLLESIKPQNAYDLISYVVMWKGEYVKKKVIRELKPFFSNVALADPSYDIDDIVPAYLENLGLVGGWRGYLAGPSAKLYGLPYGAETSILAYRKDIFDKLRLNAPITYYEFEQLLPQLRDKAGIGALSTRARAGHQCVHAWLLHLNPMGGKVFDVNWKPRLNDPIGVRALKFLQLAVETGAPGAIEHDHNEMTQAFLQGDTAMYLDSTAIFGQVRNVQKSKVDGKIAYTRHPKAIKYSSQSGGFGLALPQNAKNPEASFVLLQWLTSKEQDKAVCRLGGGPARSSTLQDEALMRQYPEYLTLRSQLKDADPDWRPIIPEWDEINNKALGVHINQALRKKQSPQAALDNAAQLVGSTMQTAGYFKA
jgi:multiple sugar transport system substrate-binding protein